MTGRLLHSWCPSQRLLRYSCRWAFDNVNRDYVGSFCTPGSQPTYNLFQQKRSGPTLYITVGTSRRTHLRQGWPSLPVEHKYSQYGRKKIDGKTCNLRELPRTEAFKMVNTNRKDQDACAPCQGKHCVTYVRPISIYHFQNHTRLSTQKSS